MGVSKKVETAFGMGMAVTFVMGVASLVTYFVRLLLVHFGIEYMQTIAFILVIAVRCRWWNWCCARSVSRCIRRWACISR